MPSTTESVQHEQERAELQAVLQSPLFARSPTLVRLLAYLCEKSFAGESGQIKEYTIAFEVFGRDDSFDQDTDSIVRVEANRLRKRLAEFYAGPGAAHTLRLTIPVGQYVPVFDAKPAQATPEQAAGFELTIPVTSISNTNKTPSQRAVMVWLLSVIGVAVVATFVYIVRERPRPQSAPAIQHTLGTNEPQVGLPVGDEMRILAGSDRNYVDRAGKLWSPDCNFDGGVIVRTPVQRIARTQDPTIYRNSRQGDFSYNIPLKPGTYELHLHFAETFYGPEEVGGGGEGSRVMTISANGKPLIVDLDPLADAGGSRIADVKVFTDISPAADGQLHLSFSSVRGGRAMLSGIEILPGSNHGIRPVRIVTRDIPYYSNDSHWWSPDIYFRGGQIGVSEETAVGADDPELYETERWGHFSYAIPVTPGKYTVILHFIERHFRAANHNSSVGTDENAEVGTRRFNVFCNGKVIVKDLNLAEEAGPDRPLVRKVTGLEPNAQGKLLLEFVPIENYATVTAIEVIPQ
jgi:hypothetical protein